jgi:hypothetical protein
MILLLHIAIALASVAFAAYGFFFPSKAKLRVSYGLIAATLTTGTYLVVTAPAHMLEACTAGLLYTSIMVVATVAVRKKMITAAERV